MKDRLKLMWYAGELDPTMPVDARRRALAALTDMIDKLSRAGARSLPLPRALAAWKQRDLLELLLLLGLALEDSDDEVASGAGRALATVGAERAVPLLTQALPDPDGPTRRRAASALAELGEPDWKTWVHGTDEDFLRLGRAREPRASAVLLVALDNPDVSDVRALAARGLGETGDPEVVPALIDALRDWRLEVRAQAIRSLSELGDQRAIPALITAVEEDDEALHPGLHQALKTFSASAVEPLIASLRSGSRQVRRRASRALAALGELSLESLSEALDDPVVRVRASACEALGELGRPAALPALIARLDDEHPEVRLAAVEALRRLGSPAAVEPLIRSLADPEGPVRHKAAQALADLGEPDWQRLVQGYAEDFLNLGQSDDERALDVLVRALSRQRGAGRAHAAKALGTLRDPRAVAPLIDALDQDDAEARRAATKALCQMGEVAREPLMSRFLDRDGTSPEVRAELALALGHLGGSGPLEPLLRALGEPSPVLRSCAASALGRLGRAEALEPLVELLADPEGEVRRCAAQALYELGDKGWRNWIEGDDEDWLRLGHARDRRALGVLRAVLKRGLDPAGRRKIAEALGRHGGEGALEPLTTLLDDGDPEVRARAAESLGQLDHPQAPDRAVAAAADLAPEVRLAAARALKKLGEPRWTELIRGDDEDFTRMSRDPDARLIEPLRRALDRTSDPALGEGITAALHWLER